MKRRLVIVGPESEVPTLKDEEKSILLKTGNRGFKAWCEKLLTEREDDINVKEPVFFSSGPNITMIRIDQEIVEITDEEEKSTAMGIVGGALGEGERIFEIAEKPRKVKAQWITPRGIKTEVVEL